MVKDEAWMKKEDCDVRWGTKVEKLPAYQSYQVHEIINWKLMCVKIVVWLKNLYAKCE